MAARRRNRLRLDERRRQLLELGIELFSGRSYDEIPIGEIARAAGISKGLLYHYFPSKRVFYVAAVRYAAEQMLHTIESASINGGAGVDGLRSGLDAFIAYVEEHAVAYRTLIKSGAADPDVAEIVEDARQRFMLQITTGAGLAQTPAALLIALAGWIGFVEAASLEWLVSRSITREALRELMVAALLGAVSSTTSELLPMRAARVQ